MQERANEVTNAVSLLSGKKHSSLYLFILTPIFLWNVYSGVSLKPHVRWVLRQVACQSLLKADVRKRVISFSNVSNYANFCNTVYRGQ